MEKDWAIPRSHLPRGDQVRFGLHSRPQDGHCGAGGGRQERPAGANKVSIDPRRLWTDSCFVDHVHLAAADGSKR